MISDVKNNDLIQIKDFTKKLLLYPSDKFKNVINQIFYLTIHILLNFGQINIGKILILLFEINVEFCITCPKHDLKGVIFEKFKNLFTYVKNINKIINGLDRNVYKGDTLKELALIYCSKHKRRK